MNNFRDNLHRAFFFPGSNGFSENYDSNPEYNETEKVTNEFQQELQDLQSNVEMQDVSGIAGDVMAEMKKN